MSASAKCNTRTTVSMRSFFDAPSIRRQNAQSVTRIFLPQTGGEVVVYSAHLALAFSLIARHGASYIVIPQHGALTSSDLWVESCVEERELEHGDLLSSLSQEMKAAVGSAFLKDVSSIEHWQFGLPRSIEFQSFGNEPYDTIRPITVHFERGDPTGVIASFGEANISMVGATWMEAFKSLQAEILDTLEDYELEESRLASYAARQLGVLRSYIQRRTNTSHADSR